MGAGAAMALAPRVARAAGRRIAGSTPPVLMTVYKSPTCGCCKEWIKHVEARGFTVKGVDLEYEALRPKMLALGVPEKLESCHTGVVGDYVVEGHVPADLIQRMLREKPKILGLAVPGMPQGSPGMEQGLGKQAYDVIAFEKNGKTRVYAKR
jgi:hypothetical protein